MGSALSEATGDCSNRTLSSHQRRHQGNQQGSALLWVMMVTAGLGGAIAWYSGKWDRFNRYVDSTNVNLFVQESVTSFNTLGLQCPGGVINIRKGSCNENKGIMLSLPEIRRMVASSNTSSGGQRAFNVSDFLVTRMLCYKQGNANLSTKNNYLPCESLKDVNLTLTPLVEQNRILGTAVGYMTDVATIDSVIKPKIKTLLEDVAKQSSQLQQQQETLKDQYKELYTKCSEYQPESNGAECPEKDKLVQILGAITTLSNQISNQNQKVTSYNAMNEYLDEASIGKTIMISNSQLAVIQATGGLISILMRQGLPAASQQASKMLPPVGNPGRSSPEAPDLAADTFNFGMLKIQPYCAQLGEDQPVLRLRASVADPTSTNPIYLAEYAIRAQKVMKVLKGFDSTSSKGGFYTMPSNFIPGGCLLEEEEDPPTSGQGNWLSDQLSK
jgi:DNA-binding transcriptional MerR regulator